MDEQVKREQVLRIYDCFNRREFDELDELLHPDYVSHGPHGDLHGRDPAKKYIEEFFAGFPDGHYDVQRIIVEGDYAAWLPHFTGTNDAPLRGMPATGRKVETVGVQMGLFTADNLAIEHWNGNDVTHMMRQLGRGPGGTSEAVKG